jgi:hypothetical protein
MLRRWVNYYMMGSNNSIQDALASALFDLLNKKEQESVQLENILVQKIEAHSS